MGKWFGNEAQPAARAKIERVKRLLDAQKKGPAK
jgi:hypothetical protein